MTTASFERTVINRMRIYVLSTDKYKTNTVVVNIARPLELETVTETALLPQVLRRGTRTYPTLKQIKEHLDELYGATFFANVMKRGERHILQFGLDIANERFLSDQTPLLERGFAFLGEMLFRPATEGDGFVEKYVQLEKDNLRRRIESLIDDKIQYAAERCIQEMCRGESYRLYTYGVAERIDPIDRRSLYAFFQNMLRTAPIDVFVVGAVTVDAVEQAVRRHLTFARDKVEPIPVSSVVTHVEDVREVVDRLNVQQGKLNLGLRTGTTVQDDDYAALVVYNGILGGFPHSKLFVNVREKASLAYYASSRLESHKGLLTIQSGIEIANYERALNIMKEQLDAIRQGHVTNEEMEKTKTMLTNQLQEMEDRPYEFIDFHYHGVLSGVERSPKRLIEQIRAVDKDAVKRVASKVTLDTIYFLRN